MVPKNNKRMDEGKGNKDSYKESIEAFKKFIKRNKNKRAGVVMHHNADLDALCSSIAIAELLKSKGIKVNVYAPTGISKQAKRLLDKYPYEVIESKSIKERNIIIVDTSSFLQLGDNFKIKKDSYVVVIDHHVHNSHKQAKSNEEQEGKKEGGIYERANIAIIKEDYTSTARIVYDIYKELGEEISKQVALFIVVGILGDTNLLRYAEVGDIKVVYELMELGKWKGMKEFLFLFSDMHDASSKGARIKALERLEVRKVRGLWVAFSRVGSHEADVARGLVSYGFDIAVVFNLSKGEVRVSARCIDSVVNKLGKGLGEVLKVIEKEIKGECGGHDTAASCNGKGMDIKEERIKKNIIRELEKVGE